MYSTYLFNFALPFTGSLLGMGIAYIVKPSAPRGLKLILSFSGAFLLWITIFHLLPSVFRIADFNAGIWIVAGLVFQILLEFLSQGAEHVHTQTHISTRLP